jgi:thiamine biosynthesis protein ThiS
MTELTIQLNNRPYPWRDGATIGSIMAENNYDFCGIIVKINEALIEEDAWTHSIVSAGDKVEIIHVFGGG